MSLHSELMEAALRANGYTYDFERMAYVHFGARHLISVEWVHHHGFGDLDDVFATAGRPYWRFWFDGAVSESARRALAGALDQRRLMVGS